LCCLEEGSGDGEESDEAEDAACGDRLGCSAVGLVGDSDDGRFYDGDGCHGGGGGCDGARSRSVGLLEENVRCVGGLGGCGTLAA
jgi:hypothetical protein